MATVKSFKADVLSVSPPCCYSFIHLLWQRANTQNANFKTIYSGQFTFSGQLICLLFSSVTWGGIHYQNWFYSFVILHLLLLSLIQYIAVIIVYFLCFSNLSNFWLLIIYMMSPNIQVIGLQKNKDNLYQFFFNHKSISWKQVFKVKTVVKLTRYRLISILLDIIQSKMAKKVKYLC